MKWALAFVTTRVSDKKYQFLEMLKTVTTSFYGVPL